MPLKKSSFILSVTCFLLLSWTFSIWAQNTDYGLRYDQWGNEYYEGTNPRPLSANAIELIGAMVNYYVPVNQMPERLGVRFYLKQPATVYLSVQELNYQHYYRMDTEISSDPLIPKEGKEMMFEWSTQEVIKFLENFYIYNLVAVARLNNSEPNMFWENVAPVIFYHSSRPDSIKRQYLFIFRTRGDAELSCKIYREESAQLRFIRTVCFKKTVEGEIWFTIFWNGLNAYGSAVGEGVYRLNLKGRFSNGYPIDQTVRFHHTLYDNQQG